jgi:hypothetical protein
LVLRAPRAPQPWGACLRVCVPRHELGQSVVASRLCVSRLGAARCTLNVGLPVGAPQPSVCLSGCLPGCLSLSTPMTWLPSLFAGCDLAPRLSPMCRCRGCEPHLLPHTHAFLLTSLPPPCSTDISRIASHDLKVDASCWPWRSVEAVLSRARVCVCVLSFLAAFNGWPCCRQLQDRGW